MDTPTLLKIADFCEELGVAAAANKDYENTRTKIELFINCLRISNAIDVKEGWTLLNMFYKKYALTCHSRGIIQDYVAVEDYLNLKGN